MQEIKMVRIEEEPEFLSPHLSPTNLSPVDVLETSSVSTFCNKRSRLAFGNCDQNCGVAEEERIG